MAQSRKLLEAVIARLLQLKPKEAGSLPANKTASGWVTAGRLGRGVVCGSPPQARQSTRDDVFPIFGKRMDSVPARHLSRGRVRP
jgi:hypothetical protein